MGEMVGGGGVRGGGKGVRVGVYVEKGGKQGSPR